MSLSNNSDRRLPGIRFVTVPPEVEEALPRMDIAAFVGFAASGPKDEPVPIEDMAQFRGRFGADLALARDPQTGEMHYANLAPAVEAFFKNGGRRCWVVRVGIDENPGKRKDFSAGLFLDPDLVGVGTHALPGEANYKLHLKGKKGEPLKGIHSLLTVDEVTLIAVPDAVHPGWEGKQASPPRWLTPPVLELKDPSALESPPGTEEILNNEPARAEALLEWSRVSQVPGGAVYTLQESEDPLFREVKTLFQGAGNRFPVSYPRQKCPQRYFYRVNARLGDRLSPWSNMKDIVLPAEDFKRCTREAPNVPDLELISAASPPGNEIRLEWSKVGGADGYVLEESGTPDFASGTIIYEGKQTRFYLTYRTGGGGPYYYRVRASGVVPAAWSNTQPLVNPVEDVWLEKPPESYDGGELLALHRALLRFCAARADMFALLSLPRHYRDKDALAHVEALKPSEEIISASPGSGGTSRSKVMPLGGGEKHVPGFGALYHPWVLVGLEAGGSGNGNGNSHNSGIGGSKGSLRYIPPDGPVCGTMAGRSLSRGAWIAPANEPLEGTVAVASFVNKKDWKRLYENQINIIRRDPRGFMLMSADTLDLDKALRPINVRRLLILLRRLALREGMTYVFQPNSRDFQRRVQHRFEQLLSRMYTRGAFAGDSPETSYQVVTDSSVNTPAGMDQGRFIVELRVAPSLPMSFITVRLVQTRDEGVTIVEI